MSDSRIKTTLQPQVHFSWEAELFQNWTWQQLRFQTIEYVSRTLSWHTWCIFSKIQEYLKRSLQRQCPIHLVMNTAMSYSSLLLRQLLFTFLLFLLTKPDYPNIKRKYTSKKAKKYLEDGSTLSSQQKCSSSENWDWSLIWVGAGCRRLWWLFGFQEEGETEKYLYLYL